MLELLRSQDNLYGEALGVALVVGPAAAAAWGMRRAYRRRRAAEEEELGPLPTVREPARRPDGEALYTGTTRGGSRAERLAAHGLFSRGPCRYWLEPGALVFHRYRGPVVQVGAARQLALVGAHAGRVLSPERIAIVGWTLGQTDLDTGFAFEDARDAWDFADRVADTLDLAPERRLYAI